MKKLLLLLALSLFLLPEIWAAHNVYFFSGNVQVLEEGKAPYSLSYINQAISEKAILRLDKDAEVILRNTAGKFAIFHRPGDFTPNEILEEFKVQQGKGLVASLARFMGSQLANNHADIRQMSESYMKQKGGVTRAGSAYPIMLWPPYGSIYDTNFVRLVWSAQPDVKKYEFVLYGSEDPNSPVQLSKTLETDTFMDVNLSDFGQDRDAYFSWVAYPEGDPNYTRYTFKITTQDNLQKLEQGVQELSSKEKNEQDRLLLEAIGYEKAGLVGKAEKTYQSLLKKYNSTVNQQLYSLFKIRNNLLRE